MEREKTSWITCCVIFSLLFAWVWATQAGGIVSSYPPEEDELGQWVFGLLWVCIGTISTILFILKKKSGFYGALVSLFFGALTMINGTISILTTTTVRFAAGSEAARLAN